MKKSLLIIGVLVLGVMLTACGGKKAFKPGKDVGEFKQVVDNEEYLLTRTVYLEVMGADEDILFSGKVTVKSYDPTAYQALKGALESNKISHSIDETSGVVQFIDKYISGTSDSYWLGYLNGDAFTNTSSLMQVREGDYVQIHFVAYK